jgi:hypothetical protein
MAERHNPVSPAPTPGRPARGVGSRVSWILVLALGFAAPASSQQSAQSCDLCHGELEFLRQHAPDLEAARRMHVTFEGIGASAHLEYTCADCHTGFSAWPHPDAGTTESCISCHEEQGGLWDEGLHAHPRLDELDPAECVDCHGIHDTLTLDELRAEDGIRVMNATCISCHETQELAPSDPHADSVSCAGCHGPHATLGVDDEASGVAPRVQAETCGACHEEPAEAYPDDTHGRSLAESELRTLEALEAAGADAPATCTSCHGGHGMLALADSMAVVGQVDACAACHADEADRFFGTYHGKATALGSHVVATCADCHGAHGVYASSEPESSLHETRVLETCQSCHEEARAAFVAYDSHPNPMDPERNRPLFYAFVFMNTLLFGVLIVFGLHTFLWWVRILLDQRKAEAAGGGTHG